MKQTDFAWTLTKYLSDYLPGQRNVSSNTIRSYRDVFKQFLIFVQEEYSLKAERIRFEDISTNQIKEYLKYIENNKKVSISTRNHRLAAIHSFYRFAQIEYPDIIFESQRILGIPFKKVKRVGVRHLTQECLHKLLSQPNTSTVKGRRDLALLTTLYDTAARVQELIDLQVQDVRLSTPATITLSGKGSKTRTIPLMGKTKELLNSYMKEHRLLDNGKQQLPLFHNSRYECFTRPGISYILKKHYKLASENQSQEPFLFPIHPHMLRHTKAVHMLEAGVPLIYIRDFLGHVSIKTTEIYLKAETELKRAALENAYLKVEMQDIPQWTENKELLQWLEDLCK